MKGSSHWKSIIPCERTTPCRLYPSAPTRGITPHQWVKRRLDNVDSNENVRAVSQVVGHENVPFGMITVWIRNTCIALRNDWASSGTEVSMSRESESGTVDQFHRCTPSVWFSEVSKDQKYNRQSVSPVDNLLCCESDFKRMVKPSLPARLHAGSMVMYSRDVAQT